MNKKSNKTTQLGIGTINKHSLFELYKRAEDLTDFIELMIEIFPKYPRENIIIACMSCLQDAYKTGQCDALNIH